MAATTNFDREDILRTWNTFRQPGEVLELRIPKAGRYKTISGYFDDGKKLADAVIGLADEPFVGIYFTINPVKPDLLARASNRYVKYAETTTSDADITALHWLPVDLDAKRPAGISSTDAEHEAAISKASEIRRWLIEEQRWSAGAFVLADSGNGGHLNVKIDLPNLPENVALVKDCLEALDFLFSDETIQVDITSQNPARIWKLYGTMARKGDNTADRPHRLAKLLRKVPETSETVTREALEALTAMLPVQEEQPKTYASGQGFDPEAYCQTHNLQVHHTKSYKGGTLVVLDECIFDSSHKLSAVIIGWSSGARTYRCRHHSCLSKHWADAKAILEPETRNQGPKQERPTPKSEPENTLAKFPKLLDLTKATGRIERVNPITGEKEADPITGEEKAPKLTLSPSKASSAVTSFMSLRTSTGDTKENMKLWRCNGKIWTPDGERQVKNLIDAVIGDLSYERGLQETLRRIRGISDIVTFDSNPYLFPALDKVIDLHTGMARDYLPEDYITFQYGAAYDDPAADYRLFLWALCSSLPDPRDVLTALDIVTAIAIRVPFEVIVLLFGGGNNGKGLLEMVILKLYTMSRVTAVKLGEMKRSQFAPGALLNKEAWIVTEVETVKDAMSVLKAEASGEMIDADVKYGDRIQGLPHAVSILDANNPFDFGDNSYGRKRRIVKLDFPYTFGDDAGMRPIDRQLKDVKIITPEVLAGVAQIVAARAPELIRSRRIYRRKSTEEQEDEFGRQQFHLATFCEECVSTTWPYTNDDYPDGATPKKLKVDDAYAAYLVYCKLFNVTTPAERVPFGRYISERYGAQSISTSETVDGKKVSYRYYPQVYLVKSAKCVFGEIKTSFNDIYYRYDISTTDLLQIWSIGNSICESNTTDTTDKVLSGVISEIERMFKFISSCQNERDISYENYLSSSVVSVVLGYEGSGDSGIHTTDGDEIRSGSVVQAKKLPRLTGLPGSGVGVGVEVEETKSNSIEAELQRGEDRAKAKEAHDRELAELVEKHTKNIPPTDPSHPSCLSSCLSCGDPIGPGYSTYYEAFCGSCGPKLAMVRPAVKAHPDGFTLSGLWEDLAARGDRPPHKEHVSGMLQYLGYIEDGSVWRLPKSPVEPDPEQVGAEA